VDQEVENTVDFGAKLQEEPVAAGLLSERGEKLRSVAG